MTHVPLNQALVLFEDDLPNIRKACLENVAALIKEYSPYKQLDVDQPMTKEAVHLHVNYVHIEQKVKPILKTIHRIDSYRMHKNNPNPPQGVTDMDIQNARDVGEDWFIQEANLSTRKPHKGRCPFHNDTDPSLQLMHSKKTGKYYVKCFVCSESWDSLKFIMTRDNLDFIPAVKYITGQP